MKFSIVTIAYNAVSFIEETMISVLKQDYEDIELIVVDGASTDGTQRIIERLIPSFEGRGISVKYTSEPDKGISDAFNKGIGKATGDVIALINSGDGLLPHALKRIAEEWQPDDEIVYGKTLAIDKENNLRYLREIPENLDLSKMVYNGLVFTHQSAFVKKSVYDRYGVYDTSYKYIMDSDLFIHFYNEGVRFRYLNETLVSMLYGGISSKGSKGMLAEKIRLSQKYHGEDEKTIRKKYYKGIPKACLKLIIRRFPRLWYCLIGEERRVKDDEYRW